MAFLNFNILKKIIQKKRRKKRPKLLKKEIRSPKEKNSRSDFEFKNQRSNLEAEKRDEKRTHIFSFIFIFTLTLLLSYQNCSQPPTQGLFQRSSRIVDPYQEPIPFAYDISIDTVSYMSCSGIRRGQEQGTYYTFKVGAYREKSGLRLSDEFKTYQEGFEKVDLFENLEKENINSKLRIQLSMRMLNNLYSGILAVNQGTQEGWEYENIFPNLNDIELMDSLFELEDEERMNLLNALPTYNKKRFFRGNLKFLASEVLAETIRGGLQGDETLLTLTFNKALQASDTKALPYINNYEKYNEFNKLKEEKEETGLEVTEEDWINFFEIDQARVYGLGYQLKFTEGVGLKENELNTQFPIYNRIDYSRTLSQIKEINLVTKNETNRVWSCDSYIIVRLDDNTKDTDDDDDDDDTDDTTPPEYLCPPEPEDPHNTDLTYQALRSVLSNDAWAINSQKKCIVSKKNYDICYKDTRTYRAGERPPLQPGQTRKRHYSINYFGGQCGSQLEEEDSNCLEEKEDHTCYRDCPHYVSVCYTTEREDTQQN